MSEFNRVETAQYSPTVCAFCHTHQGPFIDVNLEGMTIATAQGMVDFEGHIYVCTKPIELGGTGCVEQMAQLAGTMVSHTKLQVLQIQIENRERKIEKLQAELEAERDNKVVPLAEIMAEVQRQVGPRTVEDHRKAEVTNS